MSQLIEALEQMSNWVKKNIPDHPAMMQEGLSQQDIIDKISRLSFHLPQEVCDLYQWKNGGTSPFIPSPEAWDIANFPSLDEAISLALDWNNDVFSGMKVFPLFSIEDLMYWTVGSDEKQDIAPIYSNDYPEFPNEPDAPSLTAMIERELNRICVESK